jgi:hypothetical protein
MVWRKVAVAGDGGKGLTLSLSAYTKVNLQLVAYDGTATTDPVATFATRSDPANTVTHTTPTVAVTNGDSWLLSYWADKSSLTTAWSMPSGGVVRDELVDTGGGHIGSLVADSGAVVSTGTAGGLTATTDAASRGCDCQHRAPRTGSHDDCNNDGSDRCNHQVGYQGARAKRDREAED